MDEQYKLICSYLKREYCIETEYRLIQELPEILFYNLRKETWIYITIVYKWSKKTNTKGNIISLSNSGEDEKEALKNHLLVIKELNDKTVWRKMK